MNTLITASELEKCAEILKNGGLVAVPTETVYGLAGNGLDAVAVEKIYEVKGRPSVKPLSLMVHGVEAMDDYADNIPEEARLLADKYWPGPLTIVLNAKRNIPPIVLAGGTTVGLRCPDHPLTLELLKISKVPFAAPSANPSSEPSPKNAEKVAEYFDGSIEAILDGGPCGIGRESTIISMTQTPYKILRQGALPTDEIADTLAEHVTTVGITGGTGSGKTTALSTLAEMGAMIIDCDAVYHELLESSEQMLREIDEGFSGVVNDGIPDRKALAAIVFADSNELERLNRITHKYVTEKVRYMLREHAMNGGKLAAIDAVELVSSGIDKLCDITVAVTAPREMRVKRIMERDSISKERALQRINAQHSDGYYGEKCSYTIENIGSEADFKNNTKEFFAEVLKNGGSQIKALL